MAVRAENSQETELQAAALQVVCELALRMHQPGALKTLGSTTQRVETEACARAGDVHISPAHAAPATGALPADNGVMHRALAIPYELIIWLVRRVHRSSPRPAVPAVGANSFAH